MPEFENNSSNETSSSETNSGELQDVSICCIDCDCDFVWTCGEQIFFKDKGLANPPKRCKSCKAAKNERIRAVKDARNGRKWQKIEVAVNCASCDTNTTVPFYPSQGRPVYCRSCFLEQDTGLHNAADA
ncbi:MAG: zinc-ribbon domain containing protein [Acidobacteria bacterium]|nr:zinc-ribbon domain containing protein [Acidobacteriota bacterium]